jgi:hypothetical protein
MIWNDQVIFFKTIIINGKGMFDNVYFNILPPSGAIIPYTVGENVIGTHIMRK